VLRGLREATLLEQQVGKEEMRPVMLGIELQHLAVVNGRLRGFALGLQQNPH